MFSHNYFNKYIERVEEARESFVTALKNKDYADARSLVDKQFDLIHTMRTLGRNAYEELDISSFGYANGYADLFEGRLHHDVLDLIDALTGSFSKQGERNDNA